MKRSLSSLLGLMVLWSAASVTANADDAARLVSEKQRIERLLGLAKHGERFATCTRSSRIETSTGTRHSSRRSRKWKPPKRRRNTPPLSERCWRR